jgi:hypothetical protein
MRLSRLLRRFLFANVLVLGWLLGAPVEAQVLAPDTRVRVTAGEGQTIGRVDRSTADSLVLTRENGDRVVFPWGGITRIEQSTGKRGRPGRGALIGAGAATAITVAAAVFGGSKNEWEDEIHDTIVLLMLPVNAAVGAGLGALIGFAWQTDRWAVLPVVPVGGEPGGVRSGTGIMGTLRF